MQTLSLTIDSDGVALIAVDLIDRSMNVLTAAFIAELAIAVEQVATTDAIRGAVLTSSKSDSFVAGGDIDAMLGLIERGIDAVAASKVGEPFTRVLRRMETCGKPFAAAMNGLALGGGLELALACHYRVLSDRREAVVGLPEVGLGLLPAGGGTQRLPRLIGIESALGLLLTGKRLPPSEAVKAGVVQIATAPDRVVETARQWVLANPGAVQPWDAKGYRIPGGAGPAAGHVGRSFTAGTTLLAKQTQRNNPGPLALLSAVYEGTQVPFELGVRIEAKYFGQLLSGHVARNLMRTMFVNKQRADKLANRPSGVPKTLVRKLGVLGAGMMGAGIAYAGAAAGMDVILLDTTLARAEAGKAYSGAVLDKAVARGQSTRERADVVLARIHPTAAYGDLAGCQFVIEAVFESREVKAEVTRLAAAAMDGDAVFGSNTSTLPISGLAGAFARPANFIGTHFFSPVERMPLLELIVGEATSRETLARTLDLAEQLRKTPIVVRDSRGFFTSRTFGSFVKEGLAMLQEGVLPPLIENAARQAGMPVGPLAATDEVSLDITLKVYDQWVADGVQPAHEPALSIDLTRRMVTELGRSGKLAGAGFYEYPKEGKKRLWPGLAKLCPPALTQPDVEELKLRFLTIQAIEAARCMEEGVVTDPGDADVGSILGIGYPAWTGGVLSYIDTQGLERFVSTAQRMSEAYGRRYEPSPWLVQRALESRRFHASM